jgi:choline kinase
MKAIILSAGRGTRLGQLTKTQPKCLLPVCGEESLLEYQLHTLAAAGVSEACVVVGHGAEYVESMLRDAKVPRMHVRTLYNPFFDTSDNLMSCFLAREEMKQPFILLNGDTLFETRVVDRLLASPPASLTLAVNHKSGRAYDADDMKVSLDGTRLRAVSKKLPLGVVDAESIGLMVFRGDGPAHFRRALELAAREPGAKKAWYLSVVDSLARTDRVETVSISGLCWWEVDCREDLEEARRGLAKNEFSTAVPLQVLQPATNGRRPWGGRNPQCVSDY